MQQSLADDLLPRLEALTRRAGDIALRFFRPGARTIAQISYKNGGSPVTEADFAVDRFLFEETRALAPQAGWLSEETADTAERLSRDSLFVVDPIDGTQAFTRGDDRWCVSVALVERGRPTIGVIHAPALGETYIAARGAGAFVNGERLRAPQHDTLRGARIVAPAWLRDAIMQLPGGYEIAPRKPSLALRLADIAAGRHDVVVAGPNARDWDIAAADILLEEAGARLGEPDGATLTYNRASAARRMLVAAPVSLFDETLAMAHAVSEGHS